MSAEPSAMSQSVSVIAALRPTRSANAPITMPPIGRTTKPTPKLPTASINWLSEPCTGKYSEPMIEAKKL